MERQSLHRAIRVKEARAIIANIELRYDDEARLCAQVAALKDELGVQTND